MSTKVWTGRVDATEFTRLTAEEGGWKPIEGDPGVRVHTFCESEGLWTGLGCVEPSTFSYTNDGPGLIQLLEGEATETLDGRTLDLRAGDVVIVPGSVEQTWEIKTAVREFFVTFATARPTV